MKRPGLLLFLILVLLALMGFMIYVAVNTQRFPSGAKLVMGYRCLPTQHGNFHFL